LSGELPNLPADFFGVLPEWQALVGRAGLPGFVQAPFGDFLFANKNNKLA
jgi:hypothetical protein